MPMQYIRITRRWHTGEPSLYERGYCYQTQRKPEILYRRRIRCHIQRNLCREAGVPFQTFTNRSDILGGSTLGNISNTKVALNAVDIGLPQLAMHSPYETAGVKDTC